MDRTLATLLGDAHERSFVCAPGDIRPRSDFAFTAELGRIPTLTIDQVHELGARHSAWLPADSSIRLRALAERNASDELLGVLWGGSGQFAQAFIGREVELGLEIREGHRERVLDEAFEAVQRAGMAFAAGERIDESLWRLMTAPWRRVMDGEQEIYP